MESLGSALPTAVILYKYICKVLLLLSESRSAHSLQGDRYGWAASVVVQKPHRQPHCLCRD